jgi:GLPGLI family protein
MQERDEYGDMFYLDFTRNKLMIRQIIWGEAFIAEEPIPIMHWNILTDNKKLGNYSCQKATTTFRGRDYEAWFTTEIPVSDGPWKFHGLPGLILEVYDSNKEVQFLFDSITVPGLVDKDLMAPQKGSRIPFLAFKNIERTQSEKAVKLAQASVEEGTDVDVHINIYPIEKNYD